ncbi:AbrB/MazE/SpoVT family DNA-binding domain-containing protein [Paenibacillus polymyxa]|uniref:AbrB/MazE/SpoVT family DNA-binding domain-containing protein n=1 Tax=Paenibacillus polymyxa TaxID=1406 RepID=UPI001C593512|nr:AbrB/MazE/SpoVT family DNA-binding domain-containing protein [Paenibacillus polymyxa]
MAKKKLGLDNLRPVNPNGGVVIPKLIREDMEIEAGDTVQFVRLDKGQYLIAKVDPDKLNQLLTIDPLPIYSVKGNTPILKDDEGNESVE